MAQGRLYAPLLMFLLAVEVRSAPDWYMKERNAILAREREASTGSKIILTTQELEVNKIIMAGKRAEINSAIYNSTDYLPSMHFFQARPLMEKSQVFQIIRKMPKGAALHVHAHAITSFDWVVKNVTYRPHCYMCVADNTIKSTGFFLIPPRDEDCTWLDIPTERAKSRDVDAFDERFQDSFDAASGMMDFAPVQKDQLYETLRQFQDDGVQYLEIRYNSQPYELDGMIRDQNWLLKTYRDVINTFRSDFPDFSGAKFILAGMKRLSVSLAHNDVKDALDALQRYPDVFLGFDLDGQEDIMPPLLDFISPLLYPKAHSMTLPYFFHGGETDWLDIHDNNLIDAVLLNTRRIGHGFALPKHPEVMKLVKKRQIPIEVNPISNQVLKLVADLRNHPAAILITQDFPVCISSDIPAVWEALPLSHDFYMAFMALAGADDDLRFLKQMAINSIKYSAMTASEKTEALQLWQIKWIEFINHVTETNTLSG